MTPRDSSTSRITISYCALLQLCVIGMSIESLREGESVKYDVGQGPKGPRAENVERS